MKSILLVLKNVVHFKRGYLEVIPSLKHVCRVKTLADHTLNMFVLCFDLFYLLLYLFLVVSNFIEALDCISHFSHVFRFIFQLSHDVVNELLYLLTFSLNWELDNLNEALNLLINVNFQHILEISNIYLEVLNCVFFLICGKEFRGLLEFLKVG